MLREFLLLYVLFMVTVASTVEDEMALRAGDKKTKHPLLVI
jgi:hypothetical protein